MAIPISIENLKVHFCEKGNGYVISERKFLMEVSEGAVIKKQVDVEIEIENSKVIEHLPLGDAFLF